jgi:glutathione S-transferase
MSVSRISFAQKVINTRAQFLEVRARSLMFGQMPMLAIDGLELVQSQSILRYIAKRSNLQGRSPEEEVKADMVRLVLFFHRLAGLILILYCCMQIAESINDLIMQLTSLPFLRNDPERLEATKHIAREKFRVMSARFEALLEENEGVFLVGTSLTYVDILLAHAITWFVEELGAEILENTPLLTELQIGIISLPEMKQFLRSKKYYPIGGDDYAKTVS